VSVAVGFKDAFRSMRMKDPVDVMAQVVSVTAAPTEGATHGTAVMNLVVQMPDGQAHSIECTSMPAPVAKWPEPGGQLPVTVDASDLGKCKVRWDEVPESGDLAKQQADAMAAQMNQGGGTQIPGAEGQVMGGQVVAGGDVSDLVRQLQQQYPGAEISVEGGDASMLGGAPAASSGGGDDRVQQLERLAKLKESGALSEQEFEREKARILGQ
jgi:Short C-terminal domain